MGVVDVGWDWFDGCDDWKIMRKIITLLFRYLVTCARFRAIMVSEGRGVVGLGVFSVNHAAPGGLPLSNALSAARVEGLFCRLW